MIDTLMGGRLRSLRLARGFSRSDLAAAMRIEVYVLDQFEQGALRMSASDLFLVSRSLGVAPSQIFDCLVEPAAHEASARACD